MKKRWCYILMFLFFSVKIYGQIVDIDYTEIDKSTGLYEDDSENKAEVLKNGFIDILTNGDMQASARLLKLNIGNPNGFYMPFYIYTGASGNSLGENNLNQTLISNLLNPIGGSLNLSFNGLQQLVKPEPYRKIDFAYQFGVKCTNGEDTLLNENVNFFNVFVNLGLFFQTQAWKDNDTDNIGVFWVQGKIIADYASKNKLEKVFYYINENYFYGYSFDLGVEIDRVVNIKIGVYQFLNNVDIKLLTKPTVKLSIDYSLGK